MRTVTWGSVLLAGALVLPGQARLHEKEITGRVVKVVDGDTVHVQALGGTVKVRFHTVDAPEVSHNQDPNSGQAYGNESRDFVVQNALNKEVRVRVIELDKYGRTVGIIILSDGRNLNEELLKAGLAWWYVQYDKDNPQAARDEAEARHAGLGIFAGPDPLPPWIFRHPEMKAEWDRGHCLLHAHDCAGGGKPTQCGVRAGDADLLFTASGESECVARQLLKYQLCRSGHLDQAPAPTCKPE